MEYSFFSTAITRRRPITPRRKQGSESISHNGSNNDSNSNNSGGGGSRNLKRSLNLVDLIFYGVGCSVGAGIYSLVGIGANLAGPSIALSFLVCGVACCFTSLSYAEFAARVPLAGSAYTFAYVSFGELCGWLVGWNLTLGYTISAAVVARSWAEYLVGFIQGMFEDTDHMTSLTTHVRLPWLFDVDCCPLSMVIIGLCTFVLVKGVKESTRFNTAMTLLNLSVLGFVLIAGLGSGAVYSKNLTPVFPHGVSGMAHGAGLIFFAYLGFDMVSCLSEEVKDPERNIPIGIIGSLLVSMGIYTSVSIVVVGMAPVAILGEEIPIINALLANACCSHSTQQLAGAEDVCLSYSTCSPIRNYVLYFGSRVVSFGAIFGLTTATFACLMGQPRIFYSMSQDGLLFKIYSRVNPKTGVPTVGTILTGILTALIACFIDLEVLANVISLGTLQVFTFVNAGVIILRTRSDTNYESDEGEDDDDLHGSSAFQALLQPSPLVRDPDAATLARSLGLVKQSSRQIRQSLRQSLSGSLSPGADVLDNGAKPHCLTFLFTISILLASASLSNNWHVGVAIICILLSLVCAILLSRLPQTPPPDTFKCPLVPIVPLCGIMCNAYMMGSMPLYAGGFLQAFCFISFMESIILSFEIQEAHPKLKEPSRLKLKYPMLYPL